MDVCFTECGFKAGHYPFSEGGWREEGVPSRMVRRFCERQTESFDRPTACTIFHNGHKLYEHVPENPARQVVFSAQGAHCYFYKGCPPAVRVADLYTPPLSTLYACTKVRETFEAECGNLFHEWQPYSDLQPLACKGFIELRRPKRRVYSRDAVKVRRESMYFFTQNDDLEAIYLELRESQRNLIGDDYCFAI